MALKNINAGYGSNFVGQRIPQFWGGNMEWSVTQCNFRPYWWSREQNSSGWMQAIRTLRFQEDKVLDVKSGYTMYSLKCKQQYLEVDTLSYRQPMQISY